MTTARLAKILAATTTALGVSSTAALASAPMSVWATLDKVEITQRRDAPLQLVVEGTFVPREGQRPASGRLVYTCGEGDRQACLVAWADLAAAASSGACVGWGDPSVRTPPPSPLASPAPAPLAWKVGMGVGQSRWRCKTTP